MKLIIIGMNPLGPDEASRDREKEAETEEEHVLGRFSTNELLSSSSPHAPFNYPEGEFV